MKYFAALSAIAALAACQAEPPAGETETPVGDAEAPADETDAAAGGETAPEMLVYTDYLGEWAAPGDCERMTWDISEARFTSAGEVSCEVTGVEEDENFINVDTANCVGEGSDQPDRSYTLIPKSDSEMELRWDDQAILVERCE